ncbi:glycosyltransferase family 4 protein [Pedobacter insulae]|uniref:Glycosyltransferase involved in cell wall bisynthesis n=1 Tax=Pedobacter insulae TaxID=414048 RepID=A0A1I2THW2_9SPHI|nr:glycosyltransferase family 4 protein [Pedobacter insulae]SFG64465.1 Glycosyltransferase involved in cell wall bisynthesis [Pedobacter insulae]
MKALILTNRVPFPPNSGYPIVVYNTIKGLLNLGVEISLFSLNVSKHRVDVDDIYDLVFEKINFHSYHIDIEVNIWGAFFNIFSNQSYNVSRFYDDDAARILENVLRENEFDIIQFEGLFVVPYLDLVKANSKAKLIYRAHNIEFDVWERLAARERFTPRRKYLEFLSRRLKIYEKEQINRFHQVFAISEPDRQNILQFGCQTKLDVFPVAVDFEKYKVDLTKTSFPTLFHLGAMDWRPNKEGLEWFLEEIWPDIEKLSGELRFYIAGKNMQREFFDYDSDNLIVEGEVFDAVEFMNSKAIMIVPLLSGSGMRVKIIEGMAMKKCIIATSMAAEGIACEHGKDILIADTPDEFYRSILQCITQPHRWREIGEQARKTVERDHDINGNTKRMLAIYESLTTK